MTYNFDFDRWYENQRALLENSRAKGELTGEQLARALEQLGERYDDMLARLDRSFELPPGKPGSDE